MPRLLDQLRRRLLGEPASEVSGSDEEPAAFSEILSALPTLLGTTLLAATVVLLVLRFTSFATPKLVTFDIIKYANAQRAVASRFIGDSRNREEATTLLLDVSKHTREAIRDAAGAGTLVVISQAVVAGGSRDITDEVLTKLGLPTTVPAADPINHLIDVAPTVLGSGPRFNLEPDPIDAKPKESGRPASLP
jgi:hypothetical protein